MFSPALDLDCFPPRPRTGLRRGGPVLVREVMPAALEQLLGDQRPPDDQHPPDPRRPRLPRAA